MTVSSEVNNADNAARVALLKAIEDKAKVVGASIDQISKLAEAYHFVTSTNEPSKTRGVKVS